MNTIKSIRIDFNEQKCRGHAELGHGSNSVEICVVFFGALRTDSAWVC